MSVPPTPLPSYAECIETLKLQEQYIAQLEAEQGNLETKHAEAEQKMKNMLTRLTTLAEEKEKHQKENVELNKKIVHLEEVTKQAETLKKELAQYKETVDDLQKKARMAEQTLENVQRLSKEKEEKNTHLTQELDEQKEKVNALNEKLQEAKKQLEEKVRLFTEHGLEKERLQLKLQKERVYSVGVIGVLVACAILGAVVITRKS